MNFYPTNKIRFAIISGAENGSPKVLAITLEKFVRSLGYEARVFLKSKTIRRLSRGGKEYGRILWWGYKMIYFISDKIFLKKLRRYNLVILCDWTPNAFYNDVYDIPKFKKLIDFKPVLYYAVQYLGNAPTQIEKLKAGNHMLFEKYDWHLSVSDITEIRQKPEPPWSHIGLYLKGTGLSPVVKKEFIAVIDFAQKGFDKYRRVQLDVLTELGIKYIVLNKKYTIEEIRRIYKTATIYFMQSREAFGMPIAESLATGTYIFTPDSSWPMAWRLDQNPRIHGPGILPECFVIYGDRNDLKEKIIKIKNNYDPVKTPQKIFDIFLKNYNYYYTGITDSLVDAIERVKKVG